MHEVLRVYGEMSGKKLEHLTHIEAPWLEAREGLAPEQASNSKIKKETMLQFYSSLLNE